MRSINSSDFDEGGVRRRNTRGAPPLGRAGVGCRDRVRRLIDSGKRRPAALPYGSEPDLRPVERQFSFADACASMRALHDLIDRLPRARAEEGAPASLQGLRDEIDRHKRSVLDWIETSTMQRPLSADQKKRLIALLIYGQEGSTTPDQERTVSAIAAIHDTRGDIERARFAEAINGLRAPDERHPAFPEAVRRLAESPYVWGIDADDEDMRRSAIAAALGQAGVDDDALVDEVAELARSWRTGRYASYVTAAKSMIRRVREVAPDVSREAVHLLVALDLVDTRDRYDVMASIARRCGFRIDDLREIGRGGMSQVLKLTGRVATAESPSAERRTLAVKIPNRGLSIADESGIHAELSPPVLQNPRPDLVLFMEYLDGCDLLSDRLATPPDQWHSRALRLLRSVRGQTDGGAIVHRDLKPDNILVDGDDEFHIIDFGIAKRIPRGRIAKDDIMRGDPDYVPLEALGGESGYDEVRISARTDAYAVGCILFEMAVGRSYIEVAAEVLGISVDRDDDCRARCQVHQGILENPDTLNEILSRQCSMLNERGRQVLAGLLHPDERKRMSLARAEALLS